MDIVADTGYRIRHGWGVDFSSYDALYVCMRMKKLTNTPKRANLLNMSEAERNAELASSLMQDLHNQRDRQNKAELQGCVVSTCGEMTRAGTMCTSCTLSALAKICGDEHLPYRLDAAIREAADLRAELIRTTSQKHI